MQRSDVEAGVGSGLALRDVAPVDVLVKDLAVEFNLSRPWWTKPLGVFSTPPKAQSTSQSTRSRIALHGVSASMPSGTLTAILGGSGSGKTTLLNTISGRVTTRKLCVSGLTTFNGQSSLHNVRNSYVVQHDVLLPTLTPRETLQYAADLRLPTPSTLKERRAIVEQVILELGLKECADTRIGNSSSHKGCSGGEKRRTSIGVQMLANPSVLFCDEPTTGLDAYSAYQVINTLKKLAEGGRTVIISIHAPRSEIWDLFDRLILLSRGYTIFSGPSNNALYHFEKLGYRMPAFVNPAEFLIDLAAVDNRTEEAERVTWARVKALEEIWNSSNEKSISNASSFVDLSPRSSLARVPFGRQVRILTSRTIKVTVRDPTGMSGSIFEAVFMSVLTGLIFFNLSRDLSGIRSRQGCLYNAVSLQNYLVLLYECYRLTFDIQLFDREYSEGVVTASAFLVSRRLARLFLEDLPVPMIFSSIYYFMAGFRANGQTFFIFLALMMLLHFISITLATICVAVSRNFAGASLVANLVYTVQSLACGQFVQAKQIPVYTRWLKWTAYSFYAFGALCANEFIGVNGGPFGQFYDCPFDPADPTNPKCQEYVGKFVFESLGFPSNWLWRPIVILICYPVVHYLGAGVLLKYLKVNVTVAKAPKKVAESVSLNKPVDTRSSDGFNPVKVDLVDYTLAVETRRLSNRLKPIKKTILHPLSTSFEPGKLNVIMGPSGSGKTSLLQALALRLNDTFSSKYLRSGYTAFNGTVPSDDVVKSSISFVTQDDDALLTSLTVRETLYFAAGIRLSWKMSKHEKQKRAEDIMLKLGLKDVADNLVGSELKKGISGGEKRRVSIAIQILTDPKVLLLDEPTSGLDAFTAVSILEVLRALAEEGRTIIFTLHQARADMFGEFQNILLLARGGFPIYAGPGEGMLQHFSAFDFHCPRTSNPADFALDLVTVDLQQEEKEAASWEKVQRLVRAWELMQKGAMREVSRRATEGELQSLKKEMNPFWVTFPLVLRRSLINLKRQPDLLLARIMQVVGISIIFALFFAPLQSNYEAIQSRMGYIQENGALYFVGMLQNLAVYPMERALFYREDLDQCYTAFTFLLSYTALEIPFEIISALIFGVLTAFAVNLSRTVDVFLISTFSCFAIISCGESMGIIFCTLFSNREGFSVTIVSIFLSVANILGGILSLNVPSFLEAFNWLSPIKYQFASLAPYSMRGRTFTCSDAQRQPDGQCPISTGEQVLQLYGLDVDGGLYIIGLGVCVIAYRAVAFGVLWLARSQLTLWKGPLRPKSTTVKMESSEARGESVAPRHNDFAQEEKALEDFLASQRQYYHGPKSEASADARLWGKRRK